MTSAERRIAREWKTVQLMIRLHCRDLHGGRTALCAGCEELRAYAERRLEKCPFAEEKPTCVACPVHCYEAAMRERIRVVMRYAGPRMLLRHPVLAVRHLIDERRPLSAKAAKVAERLRKPG
ncbi:MAG: nitrous oxide-stimulated promoter family protein [Thermoanaerobaculia bacterium]